MDRSDDGNDDYVVRVRGLPWSCTEQQLRDFFRTEDVKMNDTDKISIVHFTYNREGRPSGEAYIKFLDAESYEAALRKDKEYLNKRYVEVFPSKQAEMEYVVKHSGKSSSFGGEANDDAVVRMRGLPYGCTKEEIASFFLGLEISPNGIVMLSDPYTGRATGESFVQFIGKDIAEKALQKHMQKIGHRYIEVFRSSAEEMRRFLRRAGMGGGGNGGGAPGGGNSMGAMGGSGYSDWSTGAAPTSLFGGGYGSAMGNAGGGMIDAGYGATGELMYVGRSMRPTPYDRPSYSPARPRPTPLVATMASMPGYPSRGYNGGGRMSGVGGTGGGSYKGYPEGGYASGFGGQFENARGRAGRIGSGHYVHMRGLPWSTSETEIIEFFSPLRIAGVEILYEPNGRASGEALVEFYTHADAQEAMKRDRDTLGHRYVELFLNSSNAPPAQSLYAGYRDFADDRL